MDRPKPQVPSPGWIDSSNGWTAVFPSEILFPFGVVVPVGNFSAQEKATFPWLSVGGRQTQALHANCYIAECSPDR